MGSRGITVTFNFVYFRAGAYTIAFSLGEWSSFALSLSLIDKHIVIFFVIAPLLLFLVQRGML